MTENQINTTKILDKDGFETMYLNMGPQHPSTHGVLRLGLVLDGEVIVKAEPDIGYLHRGMEKLAEKRTYQANIAMSDRYDYVCSMNNNFAVALAIEKHLGVEAPIRAQYIRILMAELNRVVNHMLFFGFFAMDLGATTALVFGFREREQVIELFESVSGARLTYNYFRVGGVARDLPSDFVEKTKVFIRFMRAKLKDYDNLVTDNVIFRDRTEGVGKFSKEDCVGYSLSGPIIRASGIKYDIRKDDTYSVYNEFDFNVPALENGDCFDRYLLRMLELRESLKIIEQVLEKLEPGEIIAKVPKVIKPPVGEAYVRTESPKGELSVYLVSDGSANPYRFHLRAPSFINLQILQKVLVGVKVADVIAILGSIDITLGEIDR
ncbi:MAG: NADH dehydrogenase [Candidatus Firestonebacteria bacterium RIFOXYC2_FULL_39_67]|nr:MAG: NADH dehydrogenase [Candidatus Firestonebacteria bacterium RIFOXYD2_FULL_39_29]OGF53245.1 MAG: NADH dehydrogenase [Candidatus Firestonebacteria bacterium RifOxyC12_full_39_7]OGF55805.1 MAG: NADH dehydrogenase [Candidatus Firestonebacteria bacterium RIFOXYC2_FULL_39_67]